MTRVAITGGCGFIGSRFIRMALERHPDWLIHNIDKLTYAGSLANLDGIYPHPRHVLVRQDVCNTAFIHDACAKAPPDIVVHFAAESHVDRSIAGSDEFIQTNIVGTHVLLEAARNHGVKKFIMVSTDEVYGSITEGSFTEESVCQPRNPYAASKLAAERLAYSYFTTYGLPVIVTRCTNNFGPHQHAEKFIPTVIRKALANEPIPVYGDGKNVRDWIYVEDHCHAIDFLIEHGAVGETYNIAGGNEVENLDVARAICEMLDKPDSLIAHVTNRLGHDRRYSISSEKLARLGWLPQQSFMDDLRKTVEWYKKL